jgi:peptidoglycan/LPS O-acetylase OafA/YrhL
MFGGFIGVDVFFVISGYLITGNIYRNISAGRFSVLDFYERRFRRIIPALAGMLLASSILAYLVFLPKDLLTFGNNLIAATLSYSNIAFYFAKSGYFNANYSSILLHTWSLGVEEQFYLVIPLVMLFIGNRIKLMRGVIAGIAIISFIAAAYVALKNRETAFYVPTLRAWELLAGSFVALDIIPKPTSRRVRELMIAAAVIMLATFAVFYTVAIPFPGAGALPPCLAAVLFILVGEQGETTLNSFLKWPPLVFIGTISYSVYLWHWPIIVMLRMGAVPHVVVGTLASYIFVLVVTLVAGTLSWKFIEQPFRHGHGVHIKQRHVFALTAGFALTFVTAGIVIQMQNGFPHRYPDEALTLSSYLGQPKQMRAGSCFIETKVSDFNTNLCLAEDSDRKNILLFGDSHAAALWWGLDRNFPGTRILQATFASCHPVYGNFRSSPCSQFRRMIFQDFLPTHKIDGVILTERWGSLSDVDQLQSSIDWFRSRNTPVFVVGPVPEYSAPLPFLIAFGMKEQDESLANRNLSRSLQTLDQKISERLRGQPGVRYISAWKSLCASETCPSILEGNVPLLTDVDHLSDQASIYLAARMKQTHQLPYD